MSFIVEPLSRFTDWAMHGAKKRVYYFSEGSLDDKDLLGLKGANLCEMARLGLPVPPGIIISSEACVEHFKEKKVESSLSDSLVQEFTRGIHDVERKTGMFFGGLDTTNATKDNPRIVHDIFPLLLSVRAGAGVDIPGMLDTVLNLGMTDTSANIIANLTNLRFASDTYRRFLQMYGTLVLGVDPKRYEDILEFARKKKGVDQDCLLEQEDLTSIVTEFKAITDVPQDPWKQLEKMIFAVFHSWNSPRAIAYREAHDISADLGVAVTIQAMVFGNYNERSGCGFAYTRNPTTGENAICGRYLSFCEGDDVYCDVHRAVDLEEMRQNLPGCYDNLIHFDKTLERHYRDMLCIEFTVQNGALYILECFNARRTAKAGVRVAVSMVQENLITERDAILRINPELMHTFLYPIVDPSIGASGMQGISTVIIGQGRSVSPGTVAGKIVFSFDQAQSCKKEQDNAIYCIEDQAHFDQRCLEVADAFVFCRGDLNFELTSMLSDAGKPSISKSDLIVDEGNQTLSGGVGGKQTLKQGDTITVDGSSGIVYLGAVPTVPAGQDEDYRIIMRWANKYKKLEVYAAADTFEDVKKACQFQADGIGILRTDEIFIRPDRLDYTRGFLLATSSKERNDFLNKILTYHQQDVQKVISFFPGKTITVSLVDDLINRALPDIKAENFHEEVKQLASRLKMDEKQCLERCQSLLRSADGFRACRLAIVNPELPEMQARAIIAALDTVANEGINCDLRILIPGVSCDQEVNYIADIIRRAAESVRQSTNGTTDFSIGAELETPRSIVRSANIGKVQGVHFASIDTDGLTRLVYGYDEQAASYFMDKYLEKEISASNPFTTLDQKAVGSLISSAIVAMRSNNSSYKVSVHGAHCGFLESVKYLQGLKVDSVCCPAGKIPLAKIAAAQAYISAMLNRTDTRIQQTLKEAMPNIWPGPTPTLTRGRG